MSIWIRGQDKEKLINVNKIDIGYICDIKQYDISGDNNLLGTYSTKEKALKALDMIQSFINNELIRDYMVFQMPLDESL